MSKWDRNSSAWKKKKDMPIFTPSSSPLSNFSHELLLLAAQAEVSSICTRVLQILEEQLCDENLSHQHLNTWIPTHKNASFWKSLHFVRFQVKLSHYFGAKFEIFWDILDHDVTIKHTGDNGVIDLMRCFTFTLSRIDGEALAQRTGHMRTLCHSTFGFMVEAFGS